MFGHNFKRINVITSANLAVMSEPFNHGEAHVFICINNCCTTETSVTDP
jgi:hypothetical protein